jgi:Protein of unknown function (DUF2863)
MRLDRPKKPRTAAVTQLLHSVTSLELAKTLPEQQFWDHSTCNAILDVLATGKDSTLHAAMDVLWEENPDAYERLADLTENCVQAGVGEDEYVYLLIAIPVLTWSRNELPAGKTDASTIAALKAALHEHWLAPDVQATLGHTLYSPDALPEGFAATAKLARKHFDQAALGKDYTATPKTEEALDPFLADCRFWLGVLRAKSGAPLFQAQLNPMGELDLSAQELAWRSQASQAARKLFIGCAYEVMPPEGYYEACRSAELEIRGFSLQASALMIMSTMELDPDGIRVVIAGCYGHQFEEYRISLMLKNGNEILQGVTWPLLGREETQEELLEEIHANLKSLGIQRIRVIDEPLGMDYCDDCATPLFPDLNAELVHPGTAEEDDESPHGNNSRIIH